MRNWLSTFLKKLGFRNPRPVVFGADWILYSNGTIKMNYGGYQEPQWGIWQKHFCWLPKKIVIKISINNDPNGSFINCSKWVWLKTIFIRERTVTAMNYGTSEITSKQEYEYAEDLFILIQKESK